MALPIQIAKVIFLAIQAAKHNEKGEQNLTRILIIYLFICILHKTKQKQEEKSHEKRGENIVALKKVVFLQSEKKKSNYLIKTSKNVRNSRNRRTTVQS